MTYTDIALVSGPRSNERLIKRAIRAKYMKGENIINTKLRYEFEYPLTILVTRVETT